MIVFGGGFLKMLIIESDDFDPEGTSNPWRAKLDVQHMDPRNIWATKKKKPYYFPLNPGWLIGIPIMVYCNPYIIEYNPIYTLNSQVFFRGSFGNLLFFSPMYVCTLPKTNMAPENRPCPKGRIVSQSPFFVGYVSFRECLSWHLKKSWGETLTFIRNFDQLAAEPRKWLLFSFEKGDQNVNTFSTTLDFSILDCLVCVISAGNLYDDSQEN